jgi:hypothetical protein
MPKKMPPKKRPVPPRRMSSKQLCTSLVAIAAFHVEDKAAQRKIYEAVRRLQLLDEAARAAGLIAADT